MLLLVNAPVDSLPEVDLGPDHAPDAEQEATFAEVQVSTVGAPFGTSAGIAASDTAGPEDPCTVTVADALTLPPELAQVTV